MNPSLRTSWWYCRAKEAKRQARLETRPPRTAVRRMDFLLQVDTVNGDSRSDTDMGRQPSNPAQRSELKVSR